MSIRRPHGPAVYNLLHFERAGWKTTGAFMRTEAAGKAGEEYARIRTEYRTDAWLYRTVTTKELTEERKPEIGPASEISPGDSVAEAQAALYYVSVDTKGEIGWASGTFRKAGCPCN